MRSNVQYPLGGITAPVISPRGFSLRRLLFSASKPGVIFDPTDITTLYQDRAGTTPVTAAGQSVGYRRDKSGRGNHQTAINDAARGIYGWMPKTGRRNFLTYTEQFDNAAWVKTGVTVTANSTPAPDGTLTADLMTGGGNWFAQASSSSGVANQTVTGSLWVYPPAGVTSLTIRIDRLSIAQGNQVVKTVTPEVWQRVTHTATLDANTAAHVLRIDLTGGASLNVWGAQLEPGSTATAYQRVVSNYDVTEAGVPSCYYVLANGVNTAYSTPTITPGTDKVQVFAGVRKNSDAAAGMLVESSATVVPNSGSFNMLAPNSTGSSGNFSFYSKGANTPGTPATSATTLAPVAAVLTGIGDISGDLMSIRTNGAVGTNRTLDQGAGNFLAYPVYIYARGGTTLPFNGYDFGHVVRFGPNLDAATIARVESLIARNTPEVTL